MEKKRIVVFCSPYYKTGGTELLHQLVYKINELGLANAFICYGFLDWKIEMNPTPPSFIKYLSRSNEVVDISKIVDSDYLIFPETMIPITQAFNKNFKWLWWLSVDNFYTSFGINKPPTVKQRLKKLLKRYPHSLINDILTKNFFNIHLVQSYYAKDHLLKNGAKSKVVFLSDFLGINIDEELISHSERKNQIIYNPLKGEEIMNRITKDNRFNWLRLEKYNNSQLSEIYKHSKVYIDFGNHPGKDRIPREAALHGCVIITNRLGSAGNNYDIQIPDEYKIKDMNLDVIYEKLNDLLENYDFHFENQRSYREKIKNEEFVFEEELSVLMKLL